MLSRLVPRSSSLSRGLSRVAVTSSRAHSQMKETSYENYDLTSQDYDGYRIPMGAHVIKEEFGAMCDGHYNKLRVLDGGCGTGNYIEILQDLGVGSIYGLELNNGMFDKCKVKFGRENGIKLFQETLLDTKFDSNMFDGIICNLVIHHLDSDETRANNWSNLREKFIPEMSRILKPKGKILINHCSPVHVAYHVYFEPLAGDPQVMKKLSHKFLKSEWLTEQFEQSGLFKDVKTVKVLDKFMEDKHYYDFKLVFDKAFQNSDSTWALLSDTEIRRIQDFFAHLMEDKQEVKRFIQRHEAGLKERGVSHTVVATKQ